MDDLAELVRLAQQGDRHAFGRIVTRFQDMAYACAFAQLGDFHLAQDAAQDAFIDAYVRLSSLREPAAFPGWFRRVLTKHSDRQRRKLPPPTLPPEEMQMLPSGLPGPELVLVQREDRQSVRDAVAALPPRQREAIVLHYLEGYSQEEVAAFLATSANTIRKRLFDARKGLAKRMREMVRETLTDNKPDDSFGAKVQFFIALKEGDVDALSELLDKDPDLAHARADWGEGADRIFNPGTTPVYWAAAMGDEPVLELLLDRGIGVDDQADGQEAPLLSAAMARQYSAVRMLLRRGADVDVRGMCEQTPLHRAAILGDLEMVEILVEAGADVSAKASGWTVADWAALKGRRELVEWLVQHGAAKPREQAREATVAPKPPDFREVPVGDGVLGRLLDADGAPVDGVQAPDAPVGSVAVWDGAAPSPVLETGIKAVDLLAPFKRGGHVGIDHCFGVGKMLLAAQIARNIAARYDGRVVYLGVTDGDPNVQYAEWRHFLGDGKFLSERMVYVLARAEDGVARRQKTVATGVAMARRFCQEGHEALLMVEGGLLDTQGVVPYLRAHSAASPQAAITTLHFAAEPFGFDEEAMSWLDAVVAFSPERANRGYYPALDPARCRSTLLRPGTVASDHLEIVEQVRTCLGRLANQNLRSPAAVVPASHTTSDPSQDELEQFGRRARRLDAFLTQPYHGTEVWMGVPGETVSLADALEGCRQILDGEHDDVEERGFGFVGTVEQAVEKARSLA